MKSILLSIKPKWVAKILNGEKTIEYATLYLISRIQSIYHNMRERCYNPKSERYERYGGRGIKICDEWLGLKGRDRFVIWAFENGYQVDYSIERIDVDKDYENLKEENKSLRENNENLDENYFDTWYACEKLKKNSDYALMFVDNVYCLVDTADNKFDVIETYTINDKGIIDNGTQKKLKAFEIIKEKGVAVGFIQLLINDNLGGVNEYNDFIGDKKLYLTKEEFNFLKEIL